MSRPWLKKVQLEVCSKENIMKPLSTPTPSEKELSEGEILDDSGEISEEEEEVIGVVKDLPVRPTKNIIRPWEDRGKLYLKSPPESENSEDSEDRDYKNRKLFQKYEKLAKKKREIKMKRMMKKKKKLQKWKKAISENSEKSEESEKNDSDKEETAVVRPPKTKLKKMKKLKKKRKIFNLFKYELKLMKYREMERQLNYRKKKKAERKAMMRKRINRSWVQQPTKLMTTETMTRPLIRELCAADEEEHGHAFDFLDAAYGYETTSFDISYPWKIADPLAFLKFIEAGRQLRQQKYEALLQNPPSEDVKIREKQKKTLESLQEIIWLMHFRRHDIWILKAVETMTKRSMFHFDEQGEVEFVKEDGLSMIRSHHFDNHKSDILEQRSTGDMLRPVFIDGISILTKFIPNFCKDRPKIPIKILINFIIHFLLDGHQVAVFLPDFCKNADDKISFDLLITHQLIRFISSPGPKAFRKSVLEEAEKTRGILVTDSEDVEIQKAVICRPVINRFTDNIADFLIMTGFEGHSEDFEAPEDVEDSENTDKLNSYQLFDKKCRMYSKEEIEELGNDKDYQLLIRDQVFLISCLCHLTNFHSKPFRLIKSFLVLINRFAPELIPKFMQKKVAHDITAALENIREAKNLEIWPLAAKY